MKNLFYTPLCAHSSKIRLILGEKKIKVNLCQERAWERRLDVLMLNPAGELPILEDEKQIIAGHYAIAEWAEDTHPRPALLPQNHYERANVRRLMAWFDEKFHCEVGQLITFEKLEKRFLPKEEGGGSADIEMVRAGLKNLKIHLSYITHLLKDQNWLAGVKMTMADLTCGAHLSCVDYTSDIIWDDYPQLRDYYAKLKSRPSFRSLLADQVPGHRPPPHYANLDF